MRLLVGQGERFPNLLRSPVQMAEKRQEPGALGEAKYSRIQPIKKCMNVMFLRVIESEGSFNVRQGGGQLSEKEQRISFRQVSFHQKTRVLCTLGWTRELLCEVKCRLQLSAYEMEGAKSKQDRKQLSLLSHL